MRLPTTAKIQTDGGNRIELGSIVEYEQHGAPQLAAVTGEKKDKWVVVNTAATQLELPAARLYLLPGKIPDTAVDLQGKAKYLVKLQLEATEAYNQINLDELWQILSEEGAEYSVRELAELGLGDNSLISHLAMRRALLSDEVFFKRKKNTFEPRDVEAVEQLKIKVMIERQKQQAKDDLINALVKRLRGDSIELPKSVELIERYAVLGKGTENAKDAAFIVDEVIKNAGVSLDEKMGGRAFSLLVKARHFTADQNVALIRLGRHVDFSPEILAEASDIRAKVEEIVNASGSEHVVDKLVFTIDNLDTKDFDDALTLIETETGYTVGIYITDVSAVIPNGSALEKEAFNRATSIYCPDAHIPMFPREISEESLSLLENSFRPVMGFFVDFDRDLRIQQRRILRTVVRISKRMTYEEVDTILFDSNNADSEATRLLQHSLLKLWDIACSLEAGRISRGAMQFNRRDMNPKLLPDGKIILEDNNEDTPAHKLVSEMMILANETAALYAKEHKLPLVFRGQETPDVDVGSQGLHIPEGTARDFFRRSFMKRSITDYTPMLHFGLGLDAYAQVTSPLRRAVDLINQRQIAEYLQTGKVKYSTEDIANLLVATEAGLDEAQQIQKERNRYWLLKYLQAEGIKEISAVILKTDGVRPLAELDIIFSIFAFNPIGEKKDQAQLKTRLGQKIRLRIDSIDPRKEVLTLQEIPNS